MKKAAVLVLLGLSLSACGSGKPALDAPQEAKHFALDSLGELVASTPGVSYDPDVSTDGRGSIRVDATGKVTVPLFEIRDVSCENCILAYQARLKTENLEGQAYLEMWVRVPQGEFFSRSVDHPLTGSTDWMRVSTPFFLQAGQAPDLLRLNLVVVGRGRAWIDDVRLQRASMPPAMPAR